MSKEKNKWRKSTNLVHEAEPRTAYGETGETLFLTSGYVYDSAEQAQARFWVRITVINIAASGIRQCEALKSE